MPPEDDEHQSPRALDGEPSSDDLPGAEQANDPSPEAPVESASSDAERADSPSQDVPAEAVPTEPASGEAYGYDEAGYDSGGDAEGGYEEGGYEGEGSVEAADDEAAYDEAGYDEAGYDEAAYDEAYPAEVGVDDGYDAEEADPVAVPARRPPARRAPARRPPARRPATTAGRAPSRRRPPPRRTAPTDADAVPSRGPSRRNVVIVLSVLTVAVIALAIWGVSLSRRAEDKAGPPDSTAPATTLATLPDDAFVSFTDPETNFTMRYPRTWVRTEAPLREIRLQVTDGKQYACRVQVIRTEEATTPANIANLVPVMQGIIGQGVRILSQENATVNGLIGFRFVYAVTDSTSGLEEAHLHYFLFQGHKMHSIVFAAVPSSDFAKIEGVFQQMLESFRSEPEPASTAPPTSAG